MGAALNIPLDEVLYIDANTRNWLTGQAADDDAGTPTFDVFEENTGAQIRAGLAMTKRTGATPTGRFWGTDTISAGNGYEVGRWYSVQVEATVGGVTDVVEVMKFRCVAAEAVAGEPVVDVGAISGDSTAADNLEAAFDGTGYSELLQQQARAVRGRTVWHVAKTGNDGNDGKSYQTAKLTVAGAVAVCGQGDEIVVWPNATSYSEAVDLTSLTGVTLRVLPGATITNAAAVVVLGHYCEVTGGGVVDRSAAALSAGAITASSKTGCVVRGIRITSNSSGVYFLDVPGARIENNDITASEYGALVSNSVVNYAFLIANNTIVLRNWTTCHSVGIYASGAGAVRDNVVDVLVAGTIATNRAVGIQLILHALSSGNTVYAVSSGTEDAYGLYITNANSLTASIDDWFYSESASGNGYDVYVVAGTLQIFSSYVTSLVTGTLTDNVASILADTGELQTNQGNWLTATGFSTHSAADVLVALGTGAWMTAVPWNAAWDAEVQSEVQDAIEANNLDHLCGIATTSADMTSEVVDNSILSRVLAGGDTSTFIPATMSQVAAFSAPVEVSGGAAHAVAETLTGAIWSEVGTIVGADSTTHIRDGNYQVTTAVGNEIDKGYQFDIGYYSRPTAVLVCGHLLETAPAGGDAIDLYARNYVTGAWELIRSGVFTGVAAAADQEIVIPLLNRHVGSLSPELWKVRLRFQAVGLEVGASLNIEQIVVGYVESINWYDPPTNAEMGARTLLAAAYFDPAADDVTLAASEDVYHADVFLTRDALNSRDEYTIMWYLNGAPIIAGITNPVMYVVRRTDGTDLIALTALTQVGSTGVYKLDSTTRLTAGEAGIAVVQATIDGATRSWARTVGRDV